MTEKVIVACALLLTAIYAYMTEQITTLPFGDPLGPKAFPRILTAAMIIGVILLLFEMLFSKTSDAAADTRSDGRSDEGGKPALDTKWIVAATIAFTGLYFFLFEPLGFVLSTSAYLLAMTMYFNRGKVVANAAVSLLLPIACNLIFSRLLGVELARGILPL